MGFGFGCMRLLSGWGAVLRDGFDLIRPVPGHLPLARGRLAVLLASPKCKRAVPAPRRERGGAFLLFQGNSTVKRLPSSVTSRRISAPYPAAMCLTIARPRPVPPLALLRPLSMRKNRSKMR